MSTHSKQQKTEEDNQSAQEDQHDPHDSQKTATPAPTDEEIEAKMADVKGTNDRYTDERETIVLPGSDGTVSGTAIHDWLDDDGNPIDHSDDGHADADQSAKAGPPDTQA